MPTYDLREAPEPTGSRDSGIWTCEFTIKKFRGDSANDPDAEPYEVLITDNNFAFGGISLLWEALIGTTLTAGLQPFSNANAAIGVGDSSTAFDGTHTDLQASTNKLRKGMNATFPQHADGTTNANRFISFQSTFQVNDANWAWQELAVFNAPTTLIGGVPSRMLNRKVQSLGTKTNASSWQVQAVLDIV